ncbi:mechanosensitive ion channel family protein [Inquilinus sp. Marseille-Q2685]|uniref:mechanosensitive ion channel family protein n=1 Tax=Inquilinus sp. Marseille-Q2685 TaxID=2866581 RepID=UPI001CE4457C|nr:mechanosensitive ion channel domain-containing protein [Inquilinus sp. Marseille-Q2685]
MILRAFLLRLLLLLALFPAALPAAAQQQEAPKPDFATQSAGWLSTLDQLQVQLSALGLTEDSYNALRDQAAAIVDQAGQAADAARAAAAEAKQMADALGPPPAEGAPPEAESVTADRKRLADQAAAADGQARQADLIRARADILLRSAAAARLDQFRRNLLSVSPAAFDPETWVEIPDQTGYLLMRLLRPFQDHGSAGWDGVGEMARRILFATIGLGIGWLVRRWLLRHFGRRPSETVPSFGRRVAAAAVHTIAHGVLPAMVTLAAAVICAGWLGDRPASYVAMVALGVLAWGVVCYFLTSAATAAVLTPDEPAWRLIELTDASARALHRALQAAIVIWAVAGMTLAIADGRILLQSELRALLVAAALTAGALALLTALPGSLWGHRADLPAVPEGEAADDRPPPDRPASRPPGRWPRLRLLAALLAVVVMVAGLIGYQKLALYITYLLAATIGIGTAFLILRRMVQEAVGRFLTQPVGATAKLRHSLFPNDRGLWAFETGAGLSADIVFGVAAFLALAPVLGLSAGDISAIGSAILNGATVGGVRIAPLDILGAVVAFTLGITATRFLQRRLDSRFLDKLQIDLGLKNSIRTGIGYLGVLLAALLGVGVLGLDLSNLALIAGALSVGIGFGLQNIVQNFVAGLILLVERPVKVGDWVVIGGAEGVVRRISVRATEIQTFQRSSVIVPNGNLISSQVVNWTHKDKNGRVDIPVSIAASADVEKARDLLLEIAKADSRVSAFPAPVVAFKAFGTATLDLELRCHISNVDNFAGVGTDLRFAIWKAFREANLAFQPIPADISLPQAVQVLATAVRERDGARAANGAAHGGAPAGGGEEAREPSHAA